MVGLCAAESAADVDVGIKAALAMGIMWIAVINKEGIALI
jgi:hypothetical protein